MFFWPLIFQEVESGIRERVTKLRKSPVKNLMSSFAAKPSWNPRGVGFLCVCVCVLKELVLRSLVN